MHKHLQRMAMLTTLAIGASALIVTPALAAPTAQDQDHHDQSQNQKDRNEHPEYGNNKYYQMGNKEGYEDHQKNLQRKDHNHPYKTDEDKKAHNYGYQQGWQGKDYHPEHPDPALDLSERRKKTAAGLRPFSLVPPRLESYALGKF
jgi:hypothetical protein